MGTVTLQKMIFHGSDVGATGWSPFLRKKVLTLPLFTLAIVR
jgi:hypothetical protein